MSIFDNILRRGSGKSIEQRSFFPVAKTSSIAPVRFAGDEDPFVNNCINRIASTLGQLPLNLYYHTKGGGKTLAVGDPLFKVFEDPAVEESSILFYSTLIRHLLFAGNAYVYLTKSNGRIVGFQLLNPKEVAVERTETGIKYFKVKGRTYTERDILHIPYYSRYNGTIGESPVKQMAEVIQLHSRLLEYMDVYFSNSIGERYALEFTGDEKVSTQGTKAAQLYAALEPQLRKYVTARNHSGDVMIVPQGTKLAKLDQSSNAEAELNSLLVFLEREIASGFNIPYEVLNQSEQKYSSLEQQQNDYLQTCIYPLGKHLCQTFKKIVPDPLAFLAYDYKQLLSTDTKTTVEVLRTQLVNGVISINEFRSKLGMTGIGPEGDYRFFPANMVPLTEDTINAMLANQKKTMLEMENEDHNHDHNQAGDNLA